MSEPPSRHRRPSPVSVLGALLTLVALPACTRAPLPLGPDDGAGDLGDGSSDLPDGVMPRAPVLLATGSQPVLDGITQNGGGLAFHDGTNQLAVPTLPGLAPIRTTQDRYGVEVAGNAVMTLYGFSAAAARLNAWAAGETASVEMDSRAFPGHGSFAGSPGGGSIAYTRVSDLAGTAGVVQIRRIDGTGAPVSPTDLRSLDLLNCPVALRFWDETRVVVLSCPQGGLPRVSVADAQAGSTTPLSDTGRESVEQMLFVPGAAPGARVVWTNLASSPLDPSALKSALPDGTGVKLLAAGLPPPAQSQVLLDGTGASAYYLDGAGLLHRVTTATAMDQALSAEAVARVLALSPDGSSIAVQRMDGRLSLIAPASMDAVDPPLGGGVLGAGVAYTADSAWVLYVSAGTLLGFPAHGTAGTAPATIQPRVERFAPLTGARVLALHDLAQGTTTLTVVDAATGHPLGDKDHGVAPDPGSWLVSPDRAHLFYVKGGNIYMSALP